MKNLSFFIALLIFIPISAQYHEPAPLSIDETTGKFTTSGIILMDSIPKLLLMEGAYKWLNDIKFANSLASKGIVMDESIFGRIYVNQYLISSPSTFNSKIRYKLLLEFKDGRFRYRFTDFYYLAVTKRNDFEAAVTEDDKMLVGKMLLESNAYIRNFLSEMTTFLENDKEDNDW